VAICNLNKRPGVNNVEKCGGLPEYINHVACHMLERGVGSDREAIAAAQNFAKEVCGGVAKNFHTTVSDPAKRARACEAVAAMKKLNACMSTVSRSGKAQDTMGDMQTQAAFTYNMPASDVKAQEDGTLIIEGIASDVDLDRDGEAFLPGALQAGMERYMASNPLVTYHHDPAKALGRTLEYSFLDDGKLKVKVAVDPPPAGDNSSWHALAYNSIKNGTTKGFSVGGELRGLGIGGGFQRVMTPDGPRIATADVQEIAITPLPVNPRTFFTVQPAGASKAVEVAQPNIWPDDDLKAIEDRVERLAAVFEKIERVMAQRHVSS
jgi:hypothetical protein